MTPWSHEMPLMNINAVFSKNEKVERQDKAHITKASCGYALLYKPEWNSRGSWAFGSLLWKDVFLFCCVFWNAHGSEVNILLLKISSSHST